MKHHTTSRYRRWAMWLWLLLAVVVTAPANAACGGAYQRMQVGVLPDVFLNYINILILGGTGGKDNNVFTIEPPTRRLPPSGNYFKSSFLVSTKTFNHYWTGNLDLPGVGDCNIYATTTIRNVELAETYSACYLDNLSSCVMKNHPATAAVGPAIDDHSVKEWSMRVTAKASADSGSIGAISLYGLDCQGDICEPPPCLRLLPEVENEFYEPPPPECLSFNPDADGWQSGPGIGDPYLVGRGNLYIGPRVQPAFELEAISDTPALGIDHWIVNDNPNAIILVTPKGNHTGKSSYYGVQYNPVVRRWTVVEEGDDAIIQARSKFNVYVMGDKGPGFRVSAATGGDRVLVDDELTNDNPNALLIITRLVDGACQLIIEDGPLEGLPGPFILPNNNESERWVCNEGYLEHPIAVEYDSNAGKWAIVSLDGTAFPSPVAFNVFVAGLAGTYRSAAWIPGEKPDYAGRFEAARGPTMGAVMEMPQLDYNDPNGIVLITNNLTPYDALPMVAPNPHPAGVEYDGSSWQVHNLDNGPMPSTSFNVVAPLKVP